MLCGPLSAELVQMVKLFLLSFLLCILIISKDALPKSKGFKVGDRSICNAKYHSSQNLIKI